LLVSSTIIYSLWLKHTTEALFPEYPCAVWDRQQSRPHL